MKIRFVCRKGQNKIDKNFYIILYKGNIVHVQQHFLLSDIVYIIEKRINPEKTYKDYTISKEKLIIKITDRIKKGQLLLFDIVSNKEILFYNLKTFSKIYFIHSDCSSCELKVLFSKVRLTGILDEEKNIIIFSGIASVSELSNLIKGENVTLPIFIDTRDEFDLLSLITNPRHNPLTIDIKNLFFEQEE